MSTIHIRKHKPKPTPPTPSAWRRVASPSVDGSANPYPHTTSHLAFSSNDPVPSAATPPEYMLPDQVYRAERRQFLQPGLSSWSRQAPPTTLPEGARKRAADKQRALAGERSQARPIRREVKFASPAGRPPPVERLARSRGSTAPLAEGNRSDRHGRGAWSAPSVHSPPPVYDTPDAVENTGESAAESEELPEEEDVRGVDFFRQLESWQRRVQHKAEKMQEEMRRAQEKAARMEEAMRKKEARDKAGDARRAELSQLLDQREADVKAKEDRAKKILEDAQNVRKEVDGWAEEVKRRERDVSLKEEDVRTKEDTVRGRAHELQAQYEVVQAKEETLRLESMKVAEGLRMKEEALQKKEDDQRVLADFNTAKEKELQEMSSTLRVKEADLLNREGLATRTGLRAQLLRDESRRELQTANKMQEDIRKQGEVTANIVKGMKQWEADLKRREEEGRTKESKMSDREAAALLREKDALVMEKEATFRKVLLVNDEVRLASKEKDVKRKAEEVRRREEELERREEMDGRDERREDAMPTQPQAVSRTSSRREPPHRASSTRANTPSARPAA